MNWPTFFIICFGVGAGFVVISMIFGEVLNVLSSGFGTGPAPFKPLLLALFLTVFGGLGIIFYQFLPGLLAAGIGFGAGALAAFFLHRVIIVRLLKWQSTSVHEKQGLIGHTAKVAEAIPQDGYGKITYTINDKIVSGPAKAENGAEIKRNEKVEIVRIEKHTYYVRRKI